MAHNTHIRLALVALLLSSIVALPIESHQSNAGNPTTLPLNCTAPTISFGPCPEEAPPALECATYSVPINWDEPEGEHFDLGLVRLRANVNSTKRIGSLFINPGGPGGSAVAAIASVASVGLSLPDGFSDAFDLIGLDPRGVGASSQVQCDQRIWGERVSYFPKTQEEYDALVDKNKRYGESCRDRTGSLLEYLDTVSAAKDHEAVRIALGNEPLNMIGLSYGSQLGAQYAALFPDNIRTLVLDGMLQHSQSDLSDSLIEALGYSIGLTDFFAWASEEDTSPFKGEDVEEIWDSLLTNASTKPIPAPSCNGTDCRINVNAEEILFNAQTGLLGGVPTWGNLASAIYNATQGDASALSTLVEDPITAASIAISCLDHNNDPSVLDLTYLRAKQHLFDTYKMPSHGASETTFNQHSCIGWPIASRNPPQKLHVDTKATILMVNSDKDPSTPYPWAVGMLEEIRNKAFVTRVGDGHTSLLTGGETTDVIVKYLISGVAPKDGLILES